MNGLPAGIDLGKIGPYGVLGICAWGIRELWTSLTITSNEALLAYVALGFGAISLAFVLTLRTDIKTIVDKMITAVELINKSMNDNSAVLAKLAERTRIEDLIERRNDERVPRTPKRQ